MLLALLPLACSGAGSPRIYGTSVVIPTTLGEGSNESAKVAPAPSARPASVREQPPPPKGSLPDPEPLRQVEQVEYELEWKRGTIEVLATTRKKFARPVVTARRMGRFAIELWIGPELVERVRFDFPLLAAPEVAQTNDARPRPPSLEKGLHAKQRVLVPRAARARRAVLVDRATSETIALPWPP